MSEVMANAVYRNLQVADIRGIWYVQRQHSAMDREVRPRLMEALCRRSRKRASGSISISWQEAFGSCRGRPGIKEAQQMRDVSRNILEEVAE